MIAFGECCAQTIDPGMVVFLEGDLGAGKTTLSKGLLKAWGYKGNVTSPTFSLLESYVLKRFEVHHFDLYRLESADELEMIGARELFSSQSICLVEWPDKGSGFLPQPDLQIVITHHDQTRQLQLYGQAAKALNLMKPLHHSK